MPRPKTIYSSEFPYHIRARCINKEWFQIPMPEVWKIFEDYLYGARQFYDLRTHSFVLMSNHFHLFAATPQANISEITQYLLRETSREITRLSGRVNQTYGGPYKASLVNSPYYLNQLYKYIYRNPVKAGLVKRVEEYRYSTLRGLLGLQKCSMIVEPDPFLFDSSMEKTLEWLNAPLSQEVGEQIRKGLKKAEFEPSRNRKTRKKTL